MSVAPHDHRLEAGAALVVVLVGLAILKPWGSPGVPETPGQVAPASVAATTAGKPAASAHAASAGPSAASGEATRIAATPSFPCYLPTGWRLVVLDRELGAATRTWVAVAPARGAPPSEAAIDWIPFSSAEPIAIGFCAPAWGPEAAAWTGRRPRIDEAWLDASSGGDSNWQPVTVSALGDTSSAELDAVRDGDGGAFAVLDQLALGAGARGGGAPAGSPGATAAASQDAATAPGPGAATTPGPGAATTPAPSSGTWKAGRYVVAVGEADGPATAWFAFVVGAGLSASR